MASSPEFVRNTVRILGQTSGGDNIVVQVDQNGALVSTLSVEGVIIEAPQVNDKYETVSGTINDGQSNVTIPLGDVTTGYAIEILNLTSNTTFTASIDGGDAINITNNGALGRIGARLDNQKFTSCTISNSSGSNIDYEVIIQGI
jgi:hypothetical protein